MLKEILQFSLVVALVVARDSTEKKDGGVYVAPDEVLYWCTAGAPLGENLMAAMSSCFRAEEPAGTKKKALVSASQNCPSVEEAVAWFNEINQGKSRNSLYGTRRGLRRR